MTVAEILAALQAIIAEAMPDPSDPAADPAAAPVLSEDQAARYEALEAKLLVARKSEEIVKRNQAYLSTSTSTGHLVSGVKVNEDREMSRAFNAYLRTGKAEGVLARAQSEASGPAGGFFVPESFRGKIVERLKAYGGLMNEAETVSTSTGAPLYWITNDDVASNEAGIVDENAQNTFGADFVFGKNALGAYKYDTAGASGDWLKVSWELLQDSEYDLEGFIARKFAERIARKVAVDLISGSGVQEPQGIINGGLDNSNVVIASGTAGPTYAELLTIIHSIDPAYRDGAKWLMNDKTLSLIQGLVDTTGRPLLWNNNNGDLSNGLTGQTLLGYPVVIDQAMPDLLTGSTKGLIFGNLRNAYVVRMVKDFTLVTAHELFARNGQVGYLGWQRLDGMVQDPHSAVYVTSHS